MCTYQKRCNVHANNYDYDYEIIGGAISDSASATVKALTHVVCGKI